MSNEKTDPDWRSESSSSDVRSKVGDVDHAARIQRQAVNLQTYVRDALDKGRDVSEIRFLIGVRVVLGKLDTAVLITAMVDEAIAARDAEAAYDACE